MRTSSLCARYEECWVGLTTAASRFVVIPLSASQVKVLDLNQTRSEEAR
jgi:hypothetical protein